MRLLRVLHIDDDSDIREIVAISLGLDSEFEVSSCTSGKDWLAVAVEYRPDLMLLDVMLLRGVPEHIRSDYGAEMTAKVVRNWLTKVGTKTLFIEPGSP
jgi:CheY-like chemotaxis protein